MEKSWHQQLSEKVLEKMTKQQKAGGKYKENNLSHQWILECHRLSCNFHLDEKLME